jgi:GH15 family glucan-1,4-alpha-glucosidase
MCVPTWDSDGAFSTLIGGNGFYAVTPVGPYTWGGYYDRRSLIWNSRWVTTHGIVESREALALPGDPTTAIVLRRISVVEGAARLRVVLDVRAEFGTQAMRGTHRDESGVWTGGSGSIRFRWSGAKIARRGGSRPLIFELDLAAGETHDLVLELSDAALVPETPMADALWSSTEEGWRGAVPELSDRVLGRRDAEQAMAVLSGLTSAHGGMVAAATMSLPERADQNRNYDYRYAWIRDQCYSGIAVAKVGHFPLLDSAVGFISDRLLADGPTLKPAYTVRGGAVPSERTLSHLQGYPGGSDKVGNWVNEQFQLDAFGEALELFAAALACGRLDIGQWKAVEVAASAIESRWQEPDAGIWEIEPNRWAHSRLTCISGLRAIAAGAPNPQSGRWSALADAILADVASDCLHPEGRWQRAPDDPRVDASLLLPAIRGALPIADPRSISTIAAIDGELVQEGYVYRFRPDGRPLGEAEGAFLLCGFLLALAKHQQGLHTEARGLFERNRSACGTPGLMAEEFDVQQRQLRGNVPQAFVHGVMLECAVALGETEADPGSLQGEPGQIGHSPWVPTTTRFEES